MITLIKGQRRSPATRFAARDPQPPSQLRHFQTCEHLANEQTHLGYVRAALVLIALGITMNRVAVGVQELAERPLATLDSLASVGAGVVLYGLVVMLLAHHRFHSVARSIDRFAVKPARHTADLLTTSVLIGALLGVLWLLAR